jgi:membrane-bound lytic murein transglycosylase B
VPYAGPCNAGRGWSSAAIALTVLSAVVCAPPAAADDDHRGWGYLVAKLEADGVPPPEVAAAFGDPRVPRFDGLNFSLAPREPAALYRALLRPASVVQARRCCHRWTDALADAERRYDVPASVVAAILHVESGCGHYAGRSLLLPGLARLAMANEPGNVEANVDRLAGDDPAVARQVRARARYLEDTFYPEVRALFTVAARLSVDPLDLRGSESGAFGYPQFLPTSFLRFGVDADGDGRVSLYDMPDAAASCAHFLASHGWRPGLTVAQRRRVIWQYNRSDAYIDAVLTIARRIDTPEKTPTAVAHRSVKRHVVAARRRAHQPPHRLANERSHGTGG